MFSQAAIGLRAWINDTNLFDEFMNQLYGYLIEKGPSYRQSEEKGKLYVSGSLDFLLC